jgi:hypothetical protein
MASIVYGFLAQLLSRLEENENSPDSEKVIKSDDDDSAWDGE